VIGASYVALECAGFIHGVGCETTVMMRSIPLRGFDQQMAGQIKNYMVEGGIAFLEGAVPAKVELTESGKKRVTYQLKDGTTNFGEYDTVLLAVGRDVTTDQIGIEKTGVVVNPKSGKIPTVNEKTNIGHIYAIGDVIDGEALTPPSALTELTPVAIQAGKLLAERLAKRTEALMDYTNVPTTVYTPLEYGCVGLTEEEATAALGDKLEVYHTYYKPLEWTVPHRGDNACYAKLLVDKSKNEQVVGFHVCGPNAGEMTQGFAVAIKCGATKAHFDQTVGIHPTNVEWFTTMTITKSSGESAETSGC